MPDKRKVIGIIPARYASSRFPGKPLAAIQGKPMIQWVYENASKSEALSEVIVATDNDSIERTVTGFGGKVMMTSENHSSGSERCLEVIEKLEQRGKIFDVVVNIQGDEPFIEPNQIDLVSSCFSDKNVGIATLKTKILSQEELFNPNVVKVITNSKGWAIYFSRQTLPYIRGVELHNWIHVQPFYKHVGIYAYRPDRLKLITRLPISNLEKNESLEQLRWLENGFEIFVKETFIESFSVDTPDDLLKILNKP